MEHIALTMLRPHKLVCIVAQNITAGLDASAIGHQILLGSCGAIDASGKAGIGLAVLPATVALLQIAVTLDHLRRHFGQYDRQRIGSRMLPTAYQES